MSSEHRFSQVDVFGRAPFLGNPVAVVHDADDLDDHAMQTLAVWTNLSETAFLLRPTVAEADYRVRIFTPGGELPFAGHPTLGAAHTWLSVNAPERQRLVQQCAAGLVDVRRDDQRLGFGAPPTTRTGDLEPAELDRLLDGLGIDRASVLAHQWVDNGPGWAAVRLATAAEVLALEPDPSRLGDARVGVLGAYPPGSDAAFEIRAFAAGLGLVEDPVTGSLNASVAQWLARIGEVDGSYVVTQGRRVGREGEVHVEITDGHVRVGGVTRTLVAGSIHL